MLPDLEAPALKPCAGCGARYHLATDELQCLRRALSDARARIRVLHERLKAATK